MSINPAIVKRCFMIAELSIIPRTTFTEIDADLLTIHNYFQSNPITTTAKIKEACDISLPTVLRNMTTLETLGIVKEITGKERHKVFVYKEYLDLLGKGTEPLK